MVGYVSHAWNTFEPSLVDMAKQLATLGLAYYDGAVHYAENEEENHV